MIRQDAKRKTATRLPPGSTVEWPIRGIQRRENTKASGNPLHGTKRDRGNVARCVWSAWLQLAYESASCGRTSGRTLLEEGMLDCIHAPLLPNLLLKPGCAA